MSEIPYMLENTPAEFERVRKLAWPAPDIADRTAEPDAAFNSALAGWEAAEADPDGAVEKVARAIAEASDDGCFDRSLFTDEEWANGGGEEDREYYRRLAVAALAAAPKSPEVEAVRRVEALCDAADDQPDGYECRFIATNLIRDALIGPTP